MPASDMQALISAEFSIYPFIEGNEPPRHVQAAIDTINEVGVDVEVGPLGNTISGPVDAVLQALQRAQSAALAAGATRIVIRIELQG
jgi:uncharacterized protein YqgV (UPF0045/DUF77 family)